MYVTFPLSRSPALWWRSLPTTVRRWAQPCRFSFTSVTASGKGANHSASLTSQVRRAAQSSSFGFTVLLGVSGFFFHSCYEKQGAQTAAHLLVQGFANPVSLPHFFFFCGLSGCIPPTISLTPASCLFCNASSQSTFSPTLIIVHCN